MFIVARNNKSIYTTGCSRKEKVTRRQQQNRERKNITDARKRKADESIPGSQPSTSESPPPKRAAATATNTLPDAERDDSGRAQQTAKRPVEPRQPIRAQYQTSKESKTVSIIQDLCKARKDNAPISAELDLFWDLMDSWETLDQRLVVTLKEMKNDWSESTSDWTKEDFVKQMVVYHGAYNGVANCLHHIVGCMVKHAVVKNGARNSEENAQSTFEQLEDRVVEYQYAEYVKVLTKCGCSLCTSVRKFDNSY